MAVKGIILITCAKPSSKGNKPTECLDLNRRCSELMLVLKMKTIPVFS